MNIEKAILKGFCKRAGLIPGDAEEWLLNLLRNKFKTGHPETALSETLEAFEKELPKKPKTLEELVARNKIDRTFLPWLQKQLKFWKTHGTEAGDIPPPGNKIINKTAPPLPNLIIKNKKRPM